MSIETAPGDANTAREAARAVATHYYQERRRGSLAWPVGPDAHEAMLDLELKESLELMDKRLGKTAVTSEVMV